MFIFIFHWFNPAVIIEQHPSPQSINIQAVVFCKQYLFGLLSMLAYQNAYLQNVNKPGEATYEWAPLFANLAGRRRCGQSFIWNSEREGSGAKAYDCRLSMSMTFILDTCSIYLLIKSKTCKILMLYRFNTSCLITLPRNHDPLFFTIINWWYPLVFLGSGRGATLGGVGKGRRGDGW